MSNKNLTLDLKSRKDVDKNIFYVGKLKFPGTIDCSKGVVFLVFTSDQGEEQLQIGMMDDESEKQ
jgi:hypothetical protein